MAQFGVPNFADSIISGYEAGANRRERSRLAELSDRGRELSGQALAGNQNALADLYKVNPQAGMDIAKFTADQKKQRLGEFVSAAYGAKTPEAWGQVVQRFKAQGHNFGPGEEDFANRENMINQSMTLADQVGLDMQKLKLGEPTDDVKEYNLAKSQGFGGSFMDYQTGLKSAGATSVNINNAGPKGETKYQETLGANLADRWTKLAEEGDTAAEGLAIVSQLRNIMPQGGLMTGIAGKLAEWGIGGEGMSDIQATQALVDRLTPKQRVPGSGTSSDLDVKMFKSGMPSLWRTPEGNAVILDTMEALELYKQARGEIAYKLMDGTMRREDAVKAFQALPDPFATFKAYRKRGAAGQEPRPPQQQAPGAQGAGGKSNFGAGTTRSGNQFRLVQ